MKKLLLAYSIFWLTLYLSWIGVGVFMLEGNTGALTFFATLPVLTLLLFSLKGWKRTHVLLLLVPTIIISTLFGYQLYLNYSQSLPEPESAPKQYPESIKQTIIYSCGLYENDLEYCECNVEWLEQNLPVEKFMEAVNEVENNPDSNALQLIEDQINKTCLPEAPNYTPYLSS